MHFISDSPAFCSAGKSAKPYEIHSPVHKPNIACINLRLEEGGCFITFTGFSRVWNHVAAAFAFLS